MSTVARTSRAAQGIGWAFALAALLCFGCVTRTIIESAPSEAAASDGGAAGAGGAARCGTGGAPSTGGSCGSAGGAGGGTAGAGGSQATGGAVASTGGSGTGGLSGTGGSPGTGGSGTGGAIGTGGAGTGGALGTGGAAGTGGSMGTGGSSPPPACWGTDLGGVEPFYNYDHYARVMSPMPTATYFAPGLLRVWCHAPDDGNSFAPSADVLFDGVLVQNVVASQTDYYQLDIPNVPTGCHVVQCRGHFADGTTALSTPVPVRVVDVGSRAVTMTLTSDLVLSGSTDFDFGGTPGARALLTSTNGSRVISAAGWTGHFNLHDVDVIGLGGFGSPAINVATANAAGVAVNAATFDRTGQLVFQVNGTAAFSLNNSTVQPNMLIKVDGSPDLFGGSEQAIDISGSSTALKFIQGNNFGLSFVRFDHSSHWLIGAPAVGNSAQGNVSIGVRAGYRNDSGTDFTVRGNVSYHRYAYAWSQGQNMNMMAGLVEHNFVRGGSWLLDGFSGESRYNLLMDGVDEAFFRGCAAGAPIHHNLLLTVGYARINNPSAGIRNCGNAVFNNNTVDGGGTILAVAPNVMGNLNGRFTTLWNGSGGTFFDTNRDPEQITAKSNVFTGFGFFNPMPVFGASSLAAGANAADYNAWWNPDAMPLSNVQHYAQGGNGTHDLASLTATPFAAPRQVPAQIGDGALWQRALTLGQVLNLYATIYAPAPGSPLIDAGDPTGGAGNDIGAVGAGAPNPAFQFGTFP